MAIGTTYHPHTYDLTGLTADQLHAIRLGVLGVIDDKPKWDGLDPESKTYERSASLHCAAIAVRDAVSAASSKHAADVDGDGESGA